MSSANAHTSTVVHGAPPSPSPSSNAATIPVLDRAIIGRRLGCGGGLWVDRLSWLTYRWLLNLIIAMIIWVISMVIHNAKPQQRAFSVTDPNIAYPHTDPSQVSTTNLVLLSLGLPWVLFILLNLVIFKSWHDTFIAGLGVWQGFTFVKLITDILKNSAGALRPHFLAVCMPVNGICTGVEKDITNGRRSFLSGHSSYSMFGMTFLALWFAGKLGWQELYAQACCVICISLSLWTGMTRYADYDHHPIDIFAGFMLGAAFGIMVYHMYYPSVLHPIAAVRRWPKLHPQYVPSSLVAHQCCLHPYGHHSHMGHAHAPHELNALRGSESLGDRLVMGSGGAHEIVPSGVAAAVRHDGASHGPDGHDRAHSEL